jgi:hypothetical protein
MDLKEEERVDCIHELRVGNSSFEYDSKPSGSMKAGNVVTC